MPDTTTTTRWAEVLSEEERQSLKKMLASAREEVEALLKRVEMIEEQLQLEPPTS